MSELRSLLEREVERTRIEPFGVEVLLGRHERQQRNRRIRAGVVGVIVALATGIVLVRSLTSDGIPANPVEPVDPRPAPAAAGTLAYILDGDVYVADPDGSNAVKIADGLSDEECAAGVPGETYGAEGSMWSPDGRYLVYRSSDCSHQELGGGVISDAEGNVVARFPREGWDIGWSPDSTRVAVWDRLFETIAVYGVDGVRLARVPVLEGWHPSGDHDPAWLPDGTLAIDDVEIPLDGSPARYLEFERVNEWREQYLATIGIRVLAPDGSLTAYVNNGRSLMVEGPSGAASTRVRLLTVDRGTSLRIIGFSPRGDRILFSKTVFTGGDLVESSLWSVGVDGSDARLVVDGAWEGDWVS